MAGLAGIGVSLRTNRHKLELVFVALLAVVAGAPYHSVFGEWSYLVPLAVMVVLAVVISAVIRAAHGAWWMAAAAFVVVSVLYLGEVVFAGKTSAHLPTPGMLSAVWHGLTGSWSSLLSAGLPADAVGTIVVLPIVVSALAALVGAEVVLRSPWRAAPVVPAVVGYGVALAFAGRARTSSLIESFVLAAAVLALMYRRANPPLPPNIEREGKVSVLPTVVRVGSMLVAILVIGGAVGWAVPIMARTNPFGLRDSYTKPVEIRDGVTPLASLGARVDSSGADPMFTVTFRGVPATMQIDRIPFAILDTYDGASWGTTAAFDQAGRRLPAATEAVTVPTVAVQQTFTLAKGWWTSFVPALGRPTSITTGSRQLAVDPLSGMLAAVPSASSTLTYTIVSDLPTLSSSQLASGVVPPATGALARWGGGPLDQVPLAFKQFVLDHALTPSDTPMARIQAVATELRTRYGFSTKAMPGQSLGRLSELVFDDASAPNPAAYRLGSSEQYSAALALAARILGLPARVVVGYSIDPALARQAQPIEVTGADLVAWPEVLVTGAGWAKIDATATTPREPGDTAPLPPPPAMLPSDQIAKGLPTLCTTNCPKTKGAGSSSGSAWYLWLLAIPVVALVLVGLIVFGRASLRRRRVGASTPAARIVGAWKETADRLAGYGVAPRQASLTLAEVSAAVDPKAAGVAPHLEQLGPLVDLALYSPDAPTDQQASESWAYERSVRDELRKVVPLGARVKAGLDPRPLLPKRFVIGRRREPERERELIL